MTEPILSLRGVRAAYDDTQALHGVDLDIMDGRITGIFGANGAGKTTILRAVSGMVGRTGQIRFCGAAIETLRTDRISRLGIAHVPDGRGTFVNLTVEENLRIGAATRRDRSAIAADLARMFAYFPVLRQRLHQQAGTLSGGEQQMLAIARALMQRPRLLLLDEPSFGLAPVVVKELFNLIHDINRSDAMTVLLVEQNVSLALGIVQMAYVLETGRVVLSGSADSLRSNEQVRRSYLGY